MGAFAHTRIGRRAASCFVVGVVVSLATASVPAALAAGGATAPGLPTVTSGPRPGPDILYQKPPAAPQLENSGVWKAPPILVSGADAYRGGEWLYQDYLFDDHGATGVPDLNTPYGAGTNLFSPTGGTFTYPTDAVYADNAADLVEFRIKPLAQATAFRVTLNTLIDPSRTAFTIALGDSASPVAWPDGAGVSSPARYFLTWHGKAVAFTDAATGRTVSPAPSVQVDMTRRQIQLTVPHAAWNPGTSKVRTTIGVGLWDPAAGTYLRPQPGSATATTPGGGTPNGVAIVNAGPRLHEPMPIYAGTNFVDSAAAGEVNARFWRERQQSEQLALGDVSPFAVDVDFGKLAAMVTDDSDVPTTGPIDRIFASHFSSGQGVQPQDVCFVLGSFAAGAKCVGREVGQLQPYALFVPNEPQPSQGWGLTLLLHSLSVNYNQYLASRMQSELGNRGPGSLVLTPEGRGPDGFYAGVPEADTFEAWADVARHYALDPSWADVSGYSMGGFGTYRLLARWPDLFARGFSVVGAPGSVDDQLISVRNDPLLLWNATADELVNLRTSEQALKDDEAAGLQVEEDLFLTADHLTLAGNDEYGPGAAFLCTATVDRDPAHVSFVVDPTEDSSAVVANHAYWISGLATRGNGDATLDVLSKGFGQGIAPVLPVQEGAGALTGGEIPALAYASRSQQWGPAPASPVADALVVTATNLATMTIDVGRARVSCNAALDVQTDGPLSITLAGCGKTLRFG